MPARPEHRLGVDHRGRRQWADRRALGVVEGQDHDLAAERAQRDRLAELVRQSEAGGDAGDRCPRIQFGVAPPAPRPAKERAWSDVGRSARPPRARRRPPPAGSRDRPRHCTRSAGRRQPPRRSAQQMPSTPTSDRNQRQHDDPKSVVRALPARRRGAAGAPSPPRSCAGALAELATAGSLTPAARARFITAAEVAL